MCHSFLRGPDAEYTFNSRSKLATERIVCATRGRTSVLARLPEVSVDDFAVVVAVTCHNKVILAYRFQLQNEISTAQHRSSERMIYEESSVERECYQAVGKRQWQMLYICW